MSSRPAGRCRQARSLRSSKYYLKVHLGENKVHTARFHSLEDLIREKRRIDASGRLRVLQEFADFVRDKE